MRTGHWECFTILYYTGFVIIQYSPQRTQIGLHIELSRFNHQHCIASLISCGWRRTVALCFRVSACILVSGRRLTSCSRTACLILELSFCVPPLQHAAQRFPPSSLALFSSGFVLWLRHVNELNFMTIIGVCGVIDLYGQGLLKAFSEIKSLGCKCHVCGTL